MQLKHSSFIGDPDGPTLRALVELVPTSEYDSVMRQLFTYVNPYPSPQIEIKLTVRPNIMLKYCLLVNCS
jgi:hypothetical protein